MESWQAQPQPLFRIQGLMMTSSAKNPIIPRSNYRHPGIKMRRAPLTDDDSMPAEFGDTT